MKEVCSQDPSARLPVRDGGLQNLQAHPWFEGFDWKGMRELTLEPPFKPELTSSSDMSNFQVNKSFLPPDVPLDGFEDRSDFFVHFATSER